MRTQLKYANVMATTSVFIALGGVSWAAVTLPANSVGSSQLKNGAVTGPKIANSAVTEAKLSPAALTRLMGRAGERGATGVQGPVGATGPVGPTGPVGAVGSPGIPGTSGPQGPAGETGPRGLPGTPVLAYGESSERVPLDATQTSFADNGGSTTFEVPENTPQILLYQSFSTTATCSGFGSVRLRIVRPGGTSGTTGEVNLVGSPLGTNTDFENFRTSGSPAFATLFPEAGTWQVHWQSRVTSKNYSCPPDATWSSFGRRLWVSVARLGGTGN